VHVVALRHRCRFAGIVLSEIAGASGGSGAKEAMDCSQNGFARGIISDDEAAFAFSVAAMRSHRRLNLLHETGKTVS
jgi:hypothetical protein